jgi:hypothetical protein
MIWKSFAIAPRRRFIATALVYGLSLSVRLTSGAGEDAETQAQAAQGTNPMTSVMINDSAPFFRKDWPPGPALPIAFTAPGRWALEAAPRHVKASCQ